MIEKMNLTEGQPVRQLQQAAPSSAAKAGARETSDAILRKELSNLQDVKFSAHALSRIAARNIRMDDGGRAKLAEAVEMAQAKGAQESLVLLDNVAMVVSVRNRTVITVLDRAEMRGNVFTNIDSAVVMETVEKRM